MADELAGLPPEIRCVALVGQFLQAWSATELALHGAIGAALGIDPAPVKILCANIRFRDKIDILRTLVDISTLGDEQKRRVKSKLRLLGNRSKRRNMVAHDPFLPDEKSGGVKFLTVKAKGQYDAPEAIWDRRRFEQEDQALHKHAKFLDELNLCFVQQPIPQQRYSNALRAGLFDSPSGMWPMQRTMSPALAGLLYLHNQAHPDSGPTSPRTSTETPDTPGE